MERTAKTNTAEYKEESHKKWSGLWNDTARHSKIVVNSELERYLELREFSQIFR